MTRPAHTALPWRIEGPDMFGDYNILNNENALAIGAVVSNMREPANVAANAALICRAVNERADLIRALGYFLEDPRFQVAIGGNPTAIDRMMDEVRATYDRAKEPRP